MFLDTPPLSCEPLGRALGCSVTLKVETLNPVRSFKGRGTETVAAAVRVKGRHALYARARRTSDRPSRTAAGAGASRSLWWRREQRTRSSCGRSGRSARMCGSRATTSRTRGCLLASLRRRAALIWSRTAWTWPPAGCRHDRPRTRPSRFGARWALGIAAVLEEPERFAGRRVTTIPYGSNAGPADFARWVLEPPDASVAWTPIAATWSTG